METNYYVIMGYIFGAIVGILEKKMETTTCYRLYAGVIVGNGNYYIIRGYILDLK